MGENVMLSEALLYFGTFEHCRDFLVLLRWPGSIVTCPRCGGGKLCWIEKQRLWKCYAGHPSPTFTLKTGTIFENSPIALEKWLPAVWMFLNSRNGISSYELRRAIGVTQKSAWFMLQRLRLAMQDKVTGGALSGTVSFMKLSEAASLPGEDHMTFSRERFEAQPEFARFRDGMRKILAVAKGVLDRKVIEVKAASERIGDPKAPGRKPKHKPVTLVRDCDR